MTIVVFAGKRSRAVLNMPNVEFIEKVARSLSLLTPETKSALF